MFSIAILGLIVWSQVLALLFSDLEVINFTVGWEDFTLLNTFYSLDVNNIILSAGNSTFFIKNAQKLYSAYVEGGSSETIRESSFNNFKKTYESYFGRGFKESDDWLL